MSPAERLAVRFGCSTWEAGIVLSAAREDVQLAGEAIEAALKLGQRPEVYAAEAAAWVTRARMNHGRRAR